ncbi:hypothetical protein Aglo01_38420 [Actinokineospora globicatena]|nr:hypothetical protein Aglo01_38420 [Actinokineospora globicatena]
MTCATACACGVTVVEPPWAVCGVGPLGLRWIVAPGRTGASFVRGAPAWGRRIAALGADEPPWTDCGVGPLGVRWTVVWGTTGVRGSTGETCATALV